MQVFLIGLCLFAIIVVVVNVFSKRQRIKRRLNKMPRRMIAEFIEGETACISGEIILTGDILTAPLSGRLCAFYDIEVNRGSGKHRHQILSEQTIGTIMISDGTGYALVDPEHLDFYVEQDGNYSSGIFKNATQQLEDFLVSRGHKSTDFLGLNKDLDYHESVLESKESVALAGIGSWTTPNKLGLNFDANRILVISGTKKFPVRLSDEKGVLKQTQAL